MWRIIINTGRNNLLDWYRTHKRDLPFRSTKDPYLIWVSEVMLQQTRVAAMTMKYNDFIRRFPNISSLANAKEEEVLDSWSGLGYYSRARNLQRGAQFIMDTYNGYFPSTREQVLAIPGIGPYTAAAILSIAFNDTYAVLDGNVKRVLSRIHLYEEDIQSSLASRYLQGVADDFLNPEHPGDHNQALMELGATLCLPKPMCENCPISLMCKAFQTGKQTTLPMKKKEREKIHITLHFVLFRKKGKLLLVKDSRASFFKNIWSLPFFQTVPNEAIVIPEWMQKQIEKDSCIVFKGEKKHAITHHKIILKALLVDVTHLQLPPGIGEHKWIDEEKLKQEFPSSVALKLEKIMMNQV